MNQTYQFGIEEEYFLADAKTRGTPRRTVKAFHEAACTRLPRVERELLQSQVEVSSPPSTSFAEARETLAGLRSGLAEVGQSHGILVLAAGTHPVATGPVRLIRRRTGMRSCWTSCACWAGATWSAACTSTSRCPGPRPAWTS